MRGRLIGGCLETVSLLSGSPFGDVSGFGQRHAPEGLFVYLEVSGSDVLTVLRTLWALRLAGWFDYASGVIILDAHPLPMFRNYRKAKLSSVGWAISVSL